MSRCCRRFQKLSNWNSRRDTYIILLHPARQHVIFPHCSSISASTRYVFTLLRSTPFILFASAFESHELMRFAQPLEATLLSIHLIQPAVIHSPALTQLFTSSLLSSIPASPSTVQLRTTTLRLIGSYAEWFSTDQPEACLIAVGFIIKGLMEERGNPGLVGSAAKALRSLCDKARKSLIQHIASFVAVLGTLEGQIEVRSFSLLRST